MVGGVCVVCLVGDAGLVGGVCVVCLVGDAGYPQSRLRNHLQLPCRWNGTQHTHLFRVFGYVQIELVY